jgi:thiamine-phosphate pyrophosphorylase
MSRPERVAATGLCLVTDPAAAAGRSIPDLARAAFAGGADVVQVRDRGMPGGPLLRLARELLAAAAAAGARRRVVVNDRLDVALAAKAHGVHLPAAGLPVAGARDLVPRTFLVGRSVHALAEAKQAEQEGASYVFFGPVFETPGKTPYGPPQGTGALRKVVETLRIPVWAIGGVNADTIARLRGIRVAGVAVISAIAAAPDPEAAARDLRQALDAALGGPPA